MLEFGYLIVAALYVFLLGAVLKQKKGTLAQRYFSVFLCGLLLWHATIYLYLYHYWGDASLLFIGRLNYATGPVFILGLAGFFYCFPKITSTLPKWVQVGFWGASVFWCAIALLTPLVDKAEVWIDGAPVVELGDWYLGYAVQTTLPVLFLLVFGVVKLRSLKGLERVKFAHAFGVFVPTILAFFFSNLVLPIWGYIAQFYFSYLFLVPIALASYYALVRYRFFDIKLAMSRSVKLVIALVGAIVAADTAVIFIAPLAGDDLWFSVVLIVVLALSSFVAIHRVLYSSLFYRLFGYTDTEFFIKTLQDFRERPMVYQRLDELESALKTLFVVSLRFPLPRLVLRDQHDFTSPSPLSQLLMNRGQSVATKEVSYLQQEAGFDYHVSTEDFGGEVCVPLFSTSERLLGFLLLEAKPHGECYSAEELDALDQLGRFLSLALVGILHNVHLHQEVDEKTAELQEMLRQQSDFCDVTAHELRTPLSIIDFGYEDLYEEIKDNPELKEDAKTIREGIDRLKTVTDKILTVREFDRGGQQLNLSEVKGREFFDDLYQRFRPQMKRARVQFQLQNDLNAQERIRIDAEKVERLLEHVLTNAAKFANDQGEVILSVQDEGVSVLVAVDDDGIGIPAEHRERVFRRFSTTNALQCQGIALGLYICKKITDLHHGEIWAEDSSKGGARLCVRLPK